MDRGFATYWLKRPLDVLGAIFCMIIGAVPMLLIAILVRIKHGSPVIFSQERPGLNGKPFKMFKFRTMTNERDATGNLLPDKQRLTSFGKFLRAWSLDELPEVWNVLKGEMSLVGPRPLLVKYLPLYSDEQARRHIALPGITGLAQVSGRNAISWEQKFDLDVQYVESISLLVDLKILKNTVKKVIVREGISAAGEATAAEFLGAKQQPWESERHRETTDTYPKQGDPARL